MNIWGKRIGISRIYIYVYTRIYEGINLLVNKSRNSLGVHTYKVQLHAVSCMHIRDTKIGICGVQRFEYISTSVYISVISVVYKNLYRIIYS